MKVMVTGVAGFIGSSVAEELIRQGHEVLGIDCFVDFYPKQYKVLNLERLNKSADFSFEEADLSAISKETLRSWLSEYSVISHQAAQAGVRSSWGMQFEDYTRYNIVATQRMLEAAREAGVNRFVYASSSSVYGQAEQFPLREDGPTLPVSPYGVTKLAAEHLARLYHVNYNVPTVSLRYFTVYGPRQRPEMAFHRLIRCLLTGEVFPLYGDGTQSRNFTYIDDVVKANIAALFKGIDTGDPPFLGEPINVGGGARATLNEVIALAEELTKNKVNVDRQGVQKGDVDRTEADLTRAKAWLDYQPDTVLQTGLAKQIEWLRDLLRSEVIKI